MGPPPPAAKPDRPARREKRLSEHGEAGGTPAEIRIREATAMDAAAMARIHVETWRSAYAGVLPQAYLVRLSVAERTAAWREAIGRGREGHVLVAEPKGGGPAVGFGSCGSARDRRFGLGGEVYTLYVDLDWQNRGIGRRLLTALFEELGARGATGALIWVLAANPARYFYEAMGGEWLSEGQESVGGVALPTLAYAWPDLQGWLARRQRGA